MNPTNDVWEKRVAALEDIKADFDQALRAAAG